MEKRTNIHRFAPAAQTGARQKSRIVGHAAIARDMPGERPSEDNTLLNIRRIRALSEIESAITSTYELSTILDVLLRKIQIFLPIAAVTTAELLRRETGGFEVLACRGLRQEEWKSLHPPFLSAAEKAAESKSPVTVLDIETDPQIRSHEIFLKRGLVSYLGVPITAQGRALGVLGLFTRREHVFSNKDIEFLNALAGQAAIAVHAARLYEQTLRANRVKDEFLSVMSHELRTPLSVVMGYAGMIKEKMLGEINPQQEEALRKLLSRASEQLHLINVIMQTTRLEARAVAPEYHPVNLSALCAHLRSEMDATCDKKEVALRWNYPSAPLIAMTDEEKFTQILQNLVDNAVKFTAQGSVTVSVRLKEIRNQKWGIGAVEKSPLLDSRTRRPYSRVIEIKVADTGIGISADHLPFVFDKFFQVDSSGTRPFGGVGLGLYIVKQFTDLLGGKLEVESKPGLGSTFIVKVPCET
jgi:signal transduction histidine kinase